jgi:hypothetical protein
VHSDVHARALLRMYYLSTSIWIYTCLDESETAFDSHMDKFTSIITLSESLLVKGTIGDALPHFTFEMGLIPPYTSPLSIVNIHFYVVKSLPVRRLFPPDRASRALAHSPHCTTLYFIEQPDRQGRSMVNGEEVCRFYPDGKGAAGYHLRQAS